MTYTNKQIGQAAELLKQRLQGLENKHEILRAPELKQLFDAIKTCHGEPSDASFELPSLSGRFLRGVDTRPETAPPSPDRDPDRLKRKVASTGGNAAGVGSHRALRIL